MRKLPFFFSLILILSLYPLFTIKNVEAADIVDSYSETNRNTGQSLRDLHPASGAADSAGGQSFTCHGGDYNLTTCVFHMRKYGSPTGTGYARLYAHSGTYGSSSVPTGSALASSNGLDVSTLSTSYTLETFTFPSGYVMTEDEYYVIVFENPTSGNIDSNDYVALGIDSTSPTHDGNHVFYDNSAWSASSGADACFYVYGDLVTVGIDNTYTFYENLLFYSSSTLSLEVSRSFYENLAFFSSPFRNMELGYSVSEDVSFYESLTDGVEYGFRSFENFLVYATSEVGRELSFSFSETIRFFSSVTRTLELSGYEYSYTLFETVAFLSSATRGLERVFIIGDTVRFWSSVSAAFEGIGYEYSYTLFETIAFIASVSSDLEIAVAALTLNDVASLAAIAFIFGIIAFLLILAKWGKDVKDN